MMELLCIFKHPWYRYSKSGRKKPLSDGNEANIHRFRPQLSVAGFRWVKNSHTVGVGMSKRNKVLLGGCFVFWLAALVYCSFPDAQYTDFYPLWFGMRALLAGQDPYSASVCNALRESWLVVRTHQVSAVVAYPLPWLVFLAPFALLPLSWAGPLWFVLSVGLALTGLWLLTNEVCQERPQKLLFLLPVLSYPLFHASVIKTSSVLVLGITALLLWADKKITGFSAAWPWWWRFASHRCHWFLRDMYCCAISAGTSVFTEYF
jgi:hypothetical protein